MVRPKLTRKVGFNPNILYYKPRGVPLSELECVELSCEEVEALRLKNVKNLNQTQCAKKMNTSQSTFQRIINSAYKKVSQALIDGKAISIIK